MPAAVAASVGRRELDGVDAAADAVDVVEWVCEGRVVGVEREVDVADDEAGVVRKGGGGGCPPVGGEGRFRAGGG